MFNKATVVILVLAVSMTAWAWNSTIDSPQLGFPKQVTKEHIDEVLSFLTTNTVFKGGEFFTEHTHCDYAAPMSVVTDLIKLLSTRGQLPVTISFTRLKSDVTFRIYQSGNDAIALAINLNCKDPEWQKLKIVVEQTAAQLQSEGAPSN
jgi:hypothetical protein